ncbi:hypothetical protein C2L92_01280 [Coxiella burnetii]|nr:hypothetical protein B7L74_04945 [Coxiella burnetii]OYK84637.1 hypothetical protein CbuRSA315_04950 [Coxiella burnetii]OYK88455.1 hypothetical protein CbuRSA345_04950 [Coxiella burnetii]OYK91393.1 hypothetical protein CbuQ195_04985 [Coxiella burnetii]OYK91910.1 hypothetical protein CbuRSA338_04960 [Coxiella burnetii]
MRPWTLGSRRPGGSRSAQKRPHFEGNRLRLLNAHTFPPTKLKIKNFYSTLPPTLCYHIEQFTEVVVSSEER